MQALEDYFTAWLITSWSETNFSTVFGALMVFTLPLTLFRAWLAKCAAFVTTLSMKTGEDTFLRTRRTILGTFIGAQMPTQ